MNADDAVREAIASLDLIDEARETSRDEVQPILSRIAREFVNDSRSVWWWQSLVDDKPSAEVDAQGAGHQFIPELCPDEICWFVVTDDQGSNWSVFEAKPSTISAILSNCHFFEYFVASRDLDWIVFENHHDLIIGMGDSVVDRITRLSNS